MGMIDRIAAWQDTAARGDGLEVGPCVNTPDSCERIHTAAGANLWAVYVHMPEGGVEWIADYDTAGEAQRFAESALAQFPNLAAFGLSLDWQ